MSAIGISNVFSADSLCSGLVIPWEYVGIKKKVPAIGESILIPPDLLEDGSPDPPEAADGQPRGSSMPVDVHQAIGTTFLLKDPAFGRKGIVIEPDERPAEIDRLGFQGFPFRGLNAVEDGRVDPAFLHVREQFCDRSSAAAAVPDVGRQPATVEISA